MWAYRGTDTGRLAASGERDDRSRGLSAGGNQRADVLRVETGEEESSGTIVPLSQEVLMRQSTFTEPHIVSMLQEADADRPVNEIWWKNGISSATCYK